MALVKFQAQRVDADGNAKLDRQHFLWHFLTVESLMTNTVTDWLIDLLIDLFIYLFIEQRGFHILLGVCRILADDL